MSYCFAIIFRLPPLDRPCAYFASTTLTRSIVYIAHVYGEWPEVEADRYIVGADGPEALLRVLAEFARHPRGVAEIGTP